MRRGARPKSKGDPGRHAQVRAELLSGFETVAGTAAPLAALFVPDSPRGAPVIEPPE